MIFAGRAGCGPKFTQLPMISLNETSLPSAYRPHHSTDTALVLVHNDILKALDRRHGVILILLEMSAAFDTVDHDVLVTHLEQPFGVTGCAIAWIKSYLGTV